MKRRIILGAAICLAVMTLLIPTVSSKESSARPNAPGWNGGWDWGWGQGWWDWIWWDWYPQYPSYPSYPGYPSYYPSLYPSYPSYYPTNSYPPIQTFPTPASVIATTPPPAVTPTIPAATTASLVQTPQATQSVITTAPTIQTAAPTIQTSQTSQSAAPTLATLTPTAASQPNQGDTFIELADGNISINGPAAQTNGNSLVITGGGTFHIKGALTDGMIYISAGADDKVDLVLSGAKIENKSGAPIYAPQADKLNITLESDNVLTDGGANFQYADAAAEEPNAAVYAKCDIKFDGDGKLTVNAGFNNGISTSDDIDVKSGTIVIDAKNHGMRGKDSVNIKGGSLTIKTSEGDAITSTATGDDTKGWIKISGGKLSLNAGRDAVQAETTLDISGGELDITTAGGSGAVSKVNPDESYKGLKAKGNITISAGKFNIDTADDGVHTNANLTVTGGEFQIKTGDDGMHADEDLKIDGGNIKIPTCYEGIEGNNITITNGDIDIACSDDAINAAGGSSNGNNGGGGWFPNDQFGTGNSSINISGGNIKLYSSGAEGDGLDANGTINLTGGFVAAFIAYPTFGNGGIDADKPILLKGVTFISSNVTTMWANPYDQSSTQAVLNLNSGVSAGADITVSQNGTTILTYRADRSSSALVISHPDIKNGASYEVSVNGAKSTITANLSSGSSGGGGGFGNRR